MGCVGHYPGSGAGYRLKRMTEANLLAGGTNICQDEVNLTIFNGPVATQGLSLLEITSSIARPLDSSTIDSLIQVSKEMELGSSVDQSERLWSSFEFEPCHGRHNRGFRSREVSAGFVQLGGEISGRPVKRVSPTPVVLFRDHCHK